MEGRLAFMEDSNILGEVCIEDVIEKMIVEGKKKRKNPRKKSIQVKRGVALNGSLQNF